MWMADSRHTHCWRVCVSVCVVCVCVGVFRVRTNLQVCNERFCTVERRDRTFEIGAAVIAHVSRVDWPSVASD